MGQEALALPAKRGLEKSKAIYKIKNEPNATKRRTRNRASFHPIIAQRTDDAVADNNVSRLGSRAEGHGLAWILHR
jgi:hypothetical protein